MKNKRKYGFLFEETAAQSFLGLYYYMMKLLNHSNGYLKFEPILEVRGNRKPQTLFTEQDQAMAKTLVEVMAETQNKLCTWHLMQNETKHLGNLMKGGSHFLIDFNKCVYEYDQEVKYEVAWSKLVAEFNVKR